MNDERSFERTARAWLELGANQAPERAVQAVLLAIETTPQERDLRIPWRFPTMNTPLRVGAAAVIGLLLLGAGIYLFGGGSPDIGAPAGASPTPTSTPMPIPTGTSGLPVQSGTYSLDLSAPNATTGEAVPMRITFTVPEGWVKYVTPTTLWATDGRRFGFHTVDNVVVEPRCETETVGFLDPRVGRTTDDLMAALQAMPGLTTSLPSGVTFAGFAGSELELAMSPEVASCGGGFQGIWAGPQDLPNDDGGYALTSSERSHLLVLDIGGARLIVSSTSPANASPDDLGELQAILDSVRIEIREPTPPISPSP